MTKHEIINELSKYLVKAPFIRTYKFDNGDYMQPMNLLGGKGISGKSFIRYYNKDNGTIQNIKYGSKPQLIDLLNKMKNTNKSGDGSYKYQK